MGVEGFTKLVKKLAPEAIETHEYKDFPGEKWAVDSSIFFYKFCHDAQSKKPNSHIDGFYQLTMKLLKNGIQPIFITDGKKPDAKLHTLEQRSLQKQKQIDKVETLQDQLVSMMGGQVVKTLEHDINYPPQNTVSLQQLVEMHAGHPMESHLKAKLDEINKAQKNIIQFQPGTYDDIFMLCELLNVPIVRATWEADALCSKLYLTGQVQKILTEDSDILFYGGGCMARKYGYSHSIETINLQKVLGCLKITYTQFVDLCILCGTDYTVETISGLGPIRAYELISKGLTIEQIIENIKKSKASNDKSLKTYKKYDLPTDMKNFDFQKARDLVSNATKLEPDLIYDEPYDIKSIQFEKLKKLMVEKCNYKPETLDNHFKQLLESNPSFTKVSPPKTRIKLALKVNTLPNKIKIGLKSK